MSASFDSVWDETRVAAWRQRGLDLWTALSVELEGSVSSAAVEHLLERLITADNPACRDRSNAAHVMAQNDNLVILASWVEASSSTLAVALAAGLVHDLNKALGEPLREDEHAVITGSGEPLHRMETEALVVGLNHYGERTRAVLGELVESRVLGQEEAHEINRCIVHHGLGSSRFIRALVRGELGFGRADYVDEAGEPRLVLPPQPSPTLATVLHDLADSTQQMQAGQAWVSKYPLGYWRKSGVVWAELLSGDVETGGMPVGLAGQLRVELETCQEILREGIGLDVLSDSAALRLERGVKALVDSGRAWVRDDAETLALPQGTTVYHQLGQIYGRRPADVRAQLAELEPGDDPRLDARVLRVAHGLDEARANQLHAAVAKRVRSAAG